MSFSRGYATKKLFTNINSRNMIEEALRDGMFVRVREYHRFNWSTGEWDEPVFGFDHVVEPSVTPELLRCVIECENRYKKAMDSEDPKTDFCLTKYLAPVGKQEELDRVMVDAKDCYNAELNKDIERWYADQYHSLGF